MIILNHFLTRSLAPYVDPLPPDEGAFFKHINHTWLSPPTGAVHCKTTVTAQWRMGQEVRKVVVAITLLNVWVPCEIPVKSGWESHEICVKSLWGLRQLHVGYSWGSTLDPREICMRLIWDPVVIPMRSMWDPWLTRVDTVPSLSRYRCLPHVVCIFLHPWDALLKCCATVTRITETGAAVYIDKSRWGW